MLELTIMIIHLVSLFSSVWTIRNTDFSNLETQPLLFTMIVSVTCYVITYVTILIMLFI